MAREVCPKWGTFVWGDGTKYCNNGDLPSKFYAILPDTAEAHRHRYAITIKHSNGSRYSLYSILAHIGTRSYEPFPNTINVDQLTGDRISLTIKHSDGTKFQLFTVRPLIQPRRKRLVG